MMLGSKPNNIITSLYISYHFYVLYSIYPKEWKVLAFSEHRECVRLKLSHIETVNKENIFS